MSKPSIRDSKFLSLVLRHAPESIGIALDDEGWADVDTLLEAAEKHGRPISRARLDNLVQNDDKQRFAFSPAGTRIRASQGHSVAVDLGLIPTIPPTTLYHGTASRFLGEIQTHGLKRMNRQYVHLSVTIEQATKVGSRHGKPIILEVNCKAMTADSQPFYLSDNGVWLTDYVAPQYFKELE